MTNINMEVASGSNVYTMQLVVALNVVDLSDYVTRDELDAMNPMTWGNTTEE